jgi:hypothetical protein
VTSPQCKATYLQALDAIQKRIKETSKSVPCLMTAQGVSKNCTQAMSDAGYR